MKKTIVITYDLNFRFERNVRIYSKIVRCPHCKKLISVRLDLNNNEKILTKCPECTRELVKSFQVESVKISMEIQKVTD